MKTTAENNRMIAEFMGARPITFNDNAFGLTYWNEDGVNGRYGCFPDGSTNVTEENLFGKFHTSWDWLMPVASKIYLESKKLDEMKSFRMSHIIQNFQTAVVNNEISVAVHYVLDGINLLNEQK